jgi:hypothetical protein
MRSAALSRLAAAVLELTLALVFTATAIAAPAVTDVRGHRDRKAEDPEPGTGI